MQPTDDTPHPQPRLPRSRWWWWLVLLVAVVIGGRWWWLQQLNPTEQELVGVWKTTHVSRLGPQPIGYLILNSDRTAETWFLCRDSMPCHSNKQFWRASPREIKMRVIVGLKLSRPLSRTKQHTLPFEYYSKDRIEFRSTIWERVETLPEPFASAREKWLKDGKLD